MTQIAFLHGPLRDADLRAIVLGAASAGRPARLPGHSLQAGPDPDHPALVADAPQAVDGLVVDVDASARARLDFWHALAGHAPGPARAETADGAADVTVWTGPASEGSWDDADWSTRLAPLARLAAQEAMALREERPAEETIRRWPVIRTRAQARLNAAEGPGPTTLRRATGPGDVEVLRRSTPYAGFFAVEDYTLRHAHFSGGMSEPISRTAFVSADAVTVLPYDPARDRVLLIEQFRAGPFARGDPQCWSLEAIAGRIDPGESPEQSARREAIEEAGLELGRLIRLFGYYSSPGAKTEFLHAYIALADLPDGTAGLGGAPEEHEDIRGHLVSFARLEELVVTGEIANAPLLLSMLELRARRPALRDAQ
jgi:nudix-type nucleoside diphosphatase (YffH/AdpP family)